MRLQVTRISEGPGPGEVVVAVSTATGHMEQVIVHVTGMMGDTIDVGYPLASNEEQRLIELPRESMSGKWRLWVPQSAMVE